MFAVSRFRILRALTRVYVETVQNIPLLLQVFVLYAVFPLLGLTIASFWIGVIAIGAYHGGYMSEVVRSGIGSVHRGQFEAGSSLGFGYTRTMISIILPQAIRNILPALGNEAIVLLKETSVSGYIALNDLTKGGDTIRSQTYEAFLPLIAVALIYLLMVVGLSALVNRLERRLSNDKRK